MCPGCVFEEHQTDTAPKMTKPLTATLRYARGDNEALSKEKAYLLNYPCPPGTPKSNFTIDFYPDIAIRDLRQANLTYEQSGILTAQLSECMPKEDFEDESKVEKSYLPVVHRAVQEALGVSEIYIFDYMIRKREPGFPYKTTAGDGKPQPALSAHIGTCETV